MIFYLDADLAGTDSIADVFESHPKEIKHVACTTYQEFDNYVASIVTKVTPKDLVILDTINMLANTTRGDAALGTNTAEDLWEKRTKITGNNNHGATYELASQLIMRRLKNLSRSGQGARIIVLAHEAEKMDESTIPPTKRRGPSVNPAFLESLMASSSDVFRLRKLEEAIVGENGEILLPSDTRLLELRSTDEIMAKYHVPLARVASIKKALPNPTLPMLYDHLGKKPTWLTIYGSSGTGKSTLATSELR